MSRPNLTPLTDVSVLTCVFGGRSGLTRSATLAVRPVACATSPMRVQFLLALDVEEEDAVFEGVAHLGVGLADAGEDDLRAGPPGLERAVELAAAGHVEPGAVLAHEPADAEVAVGLHAVADDRVRRPRTRSESASGDGAASPRCRRTAACRTSRPVRGPARLRRGGCGRGTRSGPCETSRRWIGYPTDLTRLARACPVGLTPREPSTAGRSRTARTGRSTRWPRGRRACAVRCPFPQAMNVTAA